MNAAVRLIISNWGLSEAGQRKESTTVVNLFLLMPVYFQSGVNQTFETKKKVGISHGEKNKHSLKFFKLK